MKHSKLFILVFTAIIFSVKAFGSVPFDTLSLTNDKLEWEVDLAGNSFAKYYKCATSNDKLDSIINGVNYYFDGNYIVKSKMSEKIISNANQMARDKDGNIWVASYNGLFEYKNGCWKMLKTPNTTLQAVCIGPSSRIYIGGFNYEDANNRVEVIDYTNNKIYNTRNSPLRGDLNCMYEMKDSSLWVGTTSGVYVLKNNNWTYYDYGYGARYKSSSVRSLCQDKNGVIYVGNNGGLSTFANNQWTVTSFSTIVYSLFQTSTGDMWCGTPSSLCKLVGSTWTTVHSVSNSTAIFESSDGALYFGSMGNGLLKYKNSTWKSYSSTNGTGLNTFYYCVSETSDHKVITGGMSAGIEFLVNDTLRQTSSGGFPTNVVDAVLAVDSNNTYIGLDTGGLWKKSNGVISPVPSVGGTIMSLYKARNGDIWVGRSGSNSVARFHNNSWLYYNLSASIIKIYESKDSTIWMGSYSGLYHFNGTTFTQYLSTNSLLPNNDVYDVVEYKDEIWVATGTGIGILKNGSWRVLNMSNTPVFKSNEFKSLLKHTNGTLWLGNSAGQLIKYDGKRWTSFDATNSPLEKETSQGIYTLYQLGQYIWIGSYLGSLMSFNEWEWETYSAGLTPNPSRWQKCVQSDSSRNLIYASTGGFVTLYNPADTLYKTSGKVYLDKNKNNVMDNDEPVLSDVTINCAKYNRKLYTDNNGVFTIQLTKKNLPLSFSLDDNKFWSISSDSNKYVLNSIKDLRDTMYIGVYPQKDTTSFNVSLISTINRCRGTTNFWLDYQNVGTKKNNGTLYFKSESGVQLVSTEPAFDAYISDSNKYVWNIDSLRPFESKQIVLKMILPISSRIGEKMNYSAVIKSGNKIYSDTLKEILKCSYDPNDKVVSPTDNTTQNKTLLNTPLKYTIRFQNTGNDTAFVVRVEDTLDVNLDYNTIKIIGSSHQVRTDYNASTRLLRMYFDNILLPDSNTNAEGSQGYITFTISPKSGLQNNTLIKNTGYIYFDYNPFVKTNSVNSLYVSTLNTANSIIEIPIDNDDSQLKFVPNPMSEATKAVFKNPDKDAEFLLYDINGKLIMQINNIKGEEIPINRGSLTKGYYLGIIITNKTKAISSKLIITN